MESNRANVVAWPPALSPPGGGNGRGPRTGMVGQLAWPMENHAFENQNLEFGLSVRLVRPSIFPKLTNSEVALV